MLSQSGRQHRASRRIERSLKTARLRAPATIEDIDFRHPRGLDRAHILGLAQAHWAQHRRAIVITGPTVIHGFDS